MNIIRDRVIKEANYMMDTNETIRNVANYFQISKSTVHKDLKERLKHYDKSLFDNVSILLKNHLDERHIRGGEVTKRKYKKKV